MARLANVSKGQISEDECSALEAFMLSLCHGYLCRVATEHFAHIEKDPCFREKHYRKWKIVEIIPFSMKNAWCSVIIVLLQTTGKSTATQETSKMAERDLTYLYNNYSRREISFSNWHKRGTEAGTVVHSHKIYLSTIQYTRM